MLEDKKMNIDGVIVLAQETIRENPNWMLLVLCIVLITGFAMWIIGLACNNYIVIAFGLSMFFIGHLISGGLFTSKKVYKCVFDEDVSIQQVYEKYDIAYQDGDIWYLIDKK